MTLLKRMLDTSEEFHITLINVCFAKLQAKVSAKQQIKSYFAKATSPSNTSQSSAGEHSSSQAHLTSPTVIQAHTAVNKGRTLDSMWEASAKKRLKLQGLYHIWEFGVQLY